MNDALVALGGPVVLFGLLSALSWGAGDFGGGLASRRAPLFGVVLVTQAVGLGLAALIFLLSREPVPGGTDIAWSVASGVAGAIGIAALYGGLANGRMSIVAPVTGVLAASLPVVAGIVLQGVPGWSVLLGIVLALVAVVLVSRVSDAAAGSSGLPYAIVAGLGIGTFNITIAQVSEGLVFGPLSIMRLVQAVIFIVLILGTNAGWRIPRRILPVVALVGFLDMGGNAFYIAATQAGDLAIAATLSSLYPVTTVILAAAFLRERIAMPHAVGIVLAATAIVLIASGTG